MVSQDTVSLSLASLPSSHDIPHNAHANYRIVDPTRARPTCIRVSAQASSSGQGNSGPFERTGLKTAKKKPNLSDWRQFRYQLISKAAGATFSGSNFTRMFELGGGADAPLPQVLVPSQWAHGLEGNLEVGGLLLATPDTPDIVVRISLKHTQPQICKIFKLSKIYTQTIPNLFHT